MNNNNTNGNKNGHNNQQNDPTTNSKNVGILAIEVYTPSTFVDQSKLEDYTGVSKGKYTIGLGQERLGLICGDVEDINSLCLTVVHSLLEKYDIDPMDIGRLEVGTETLVDKSKSTKTVVMDLFPNNPNMEGATVVNACYGGTSALLNAFYWCESDAWEDEDTGKYAIVVAADIASYASGPARPTCGAGAVACLIGRDAPLVFHPREKATHATNVWDFYKPDPTIEYPVVDGALSQTCYYQALESAYTTFANKMDKKLHSNSNTTTTTSQSYFNAESMDYMIFHSPYNKLVQKSYARLYLIDARRQYQRQQQEQQKDGTNTIDKDHPLFPWVQVPIEETYNDKALEKVLKQISNESYQQRLSDANIASKLIGNTYTASVFFGLASLIDRIGEDPAKNKANTSIVLFSYGSGALATIYRLTVREPTTSFHKEKFSIVHMASTMKLTERLQSRNEVHPKELDYALEIRSKMHGNASVPYSPVYPTKGRLFPGTYYLQGMDDHWKRTYGRIEPSSSSPSCQHSTNKQQEQKKEKDSTTTMIELAPPSVVMEMEKEMKS